MDESSEEALLSRAAGGDPESFRELYARTRDRLFTVIRRFGADAATAEDLVHEAYLRVWNRRGQPPQVARAMAYLCAVALNLFRNGLGRERAVRRALGEIQESRTPQEARPQGDREDIARAILTLDDGPREAFILHRFAGLSYREISEVEGITLKAVEARMKRAFDGLREALKSYRELEDTSP
jgi:RNA polymerase sigma-70 factor (ECF subfamily)